jgi:hypothetical protein
VALVAVSGLIHVTTGLWFAVMLGVAIASSTPLRRLAIAGAPSAAAFHRLGRHRWPLARSFVTMDPTVARGCRRQGSVCAEWPIWAWVIQPRTPRDRLGCVPMEERTGLSLVRWSGARGAGRVFLVTFPLVRAKLAFPVQLQISRIFWLVDFVALICLIGVVRRERTAKIVAAILVAAALGRGIYVMTIEHPSVRSFALHLPASDWDDAMKWIKAQRIEAHVLADPGHAWKYGTSVRVAAERDVFLEEVKDAAVAIYSRDVALRFSNACGRCQVSIR